MTDALTPTVGARFALTREVDAGARATYRCVIATPTSRHHYAAELVDDGGVTLTPVAGGPDQADDGEASAELLAAATLVARLLARAAPARRADGVTVWPPRVVRWRGPGRGG